MKSKTIISFLFLIFYCTFSYGQYTYKDTLDLEVTSIKYIIRKSYSKIKTNDRINYFSIKDSTINKTLSDIFKIINDNPQNKNRLKKYKIVNDLFNSNKESIHFQLLKVELSDTTFKALVTCRYWAGPTKDNEYVYYLRYLKKQNKWKLYETSRQEITREPLFHYQ